MTTGTKYDKYLVNNCVIPSKVSDQLMMSTRQMESFGEGNFSIDCIYVTSPRLMIEKPHQHGFAQYLCFFSANPNDASDFDGEVEISLGEEEEKHIIASPTVAYIATGLFHGPLNFARIGKPILFIDIAMTGRYSRVGEPNVAPGAK
jgi:hypothetical protein